MKPSKRIRTDDLRRAGYRHIRDAVPAYGERCIICNLVHVEAAELVRDGIGDEWVGADSREALGPSDAWPWWKPDDE